MLRNPNLQFVAASKVWVCRDAVKPVIDSSSGPSHASFDRFGQFHVHLVLMASATRLTRESADRLCSQKIPAHGKPATYPASVAAMFANGLHASVLHFSMSNAQHVL